MHFVEHLLVLRVFPAAKRKQCDSGVFRVKLGTGANQTARQKVNALIMVERSDLVGLLADGRLGGLRNERWISFDF